MLFYRNFRSLSISWFLVVALEAAKIVGSGLPGLRWSYQRWPGNIRQLKNTIERALILGSSKTVVNADDIFEFVGTEKSNSQSNFMDFNSELFVEKSLRSAREEFERAYLKFQISKFGGNVSKTASYVGMERSALHRKMKLLNIESTLKDK